MAGRLLKFVLGLLAGLSLLTAGGAWYLTTDSGSEWVAGHASLYTGHDIRIDGGISLRFSPPGVSLREVSASHPATGAQAATWLEAGAVSLGLSSLSWPPASDAPLRITVRDARLDVSRLADLRDEDADPPRVKPIPPFAILARFEAVHLHWPNRKLPALRVQRASVDADPGRGIRAGIEAMLGRKPVNARFAVTLGGPVSAERVPGRVDGRVDFAGLNVELGGTIADLARLGGLDIELAAAGDIAAQAGVSTAFTEQIVNGRLAGDWGDLAFEMSDLRARTGNGRVALSGTLRQQHDRIVIEAAEVDARTEDLAAFLGDFGVESAVTSPASVRGGFAGNYDGVDVDALEFVLGDGLATLRATGRLARDDTHGVRVEAGQLSLQAADTGRLFDALGASSSRVSGRLAATARVHGPWRRLSVEDLAVELGQGVATLRGTGRLTRPGRGETLVEAGTLSLQAADAGPLVTALGATSSPVSGRLDASVELAGPFRRLSLDGFTADLGDGALEASGQGELAVVGNGSALRLQWDARATDLSGAVPLVPLPEWFGGSATAAGELHWREGRVSLADLDARFTGVRGTAKVAGEVSNVVELVAPRLRVELDAGDDRTPGVEELSLDVSLPGGLDQPAQVTMNARLRRGRLGFDGSMDLPRERRGISGDFRFEVDAGWYKGRGPGKDGAVVLAGRVENGDLGERRFEATAAIEGAAGRIHYRGQVDDSLTGGGALEMVGLDANVLAAINDVETHFPHPVYLAGTLAHDEGGLTLSRAEFFTGATGVSGGLRVQWPVADGAPARLTVNARSPGLYPADLGAGSGDDDDPTYYFSRAELPFDAIASLDMDVVLSTERLHTRAIVYRDVTLTGRARGGVLRLSSDQQLLGGRGSSLVATVDTREDPPRVDFRLTLDGIDPGELRAVRAGEDKYSGDIDAELDVRGAGRSIGAILGSANGYSLVRINHAVLPNRKLNLLSADFLLEALRTVNPFVRQSAELDIECGVVAFAVRDGIARADKSVVLKGKRLLLAAEGEIDLDTERVAFAVRPKAQEGFGLNTSGLVKFIGIGGTLSDPVIRTDPRGLLATGASIGAAFASGGMSLFLQNMFDRLTTGAGECERVETSFRERLAGTSSDRGLRTGRAR